MSTIVSATVTLEEVIPLVESLSEVERDALRQILESKTRVDWRTEWEKAVSYFHRRFAQFPEEEVEADLVKALREARSGQTHLSRSGSAGHEHLPAIIDSQRERLAQDY